MGSKKTWVQSFISDSKRFGKLNWDPKNLCQKKCGSKNILGKKEFGNYGFKNFGYKIFFLLKMILGEKK